MHLIQGLVSFCLLKHQMLFEKTRNRIKDTNKSAALGTFQKKKKKWAEIESLFGFQAPNRDKTML